MPTKTNPRPPPDTPIAGSPRRPSEIVDEASRESMVASDPPAFTSSVAATDPAAATGIDRLLDEPTRRRILERAYEIWESRGRPHGQDLEHWLMAELEVISRRGDPAR